MASKKSGKNILRRARTEKRRTIVKKTDSQSIQDSGPEGFNAQGMFEQFFENNPDYCYMVSSSGNILAANLAARTFLGVSGKKIIGLPFIPTVYSMTSRRKALELFNRWKKNGVLHNEEMTIEGKKGVVRTVLVSVDAVRNTKGQIISTISVLRDITERNNDMLKIEAANQQLRAFNQQLQAGEQHLNAINQQLSASQQQLRAANQQLHAANDLIRRQRDEARTYLQLAGVMFVAIAADGKVTLVNRKGCDILGYKEEEIVGKDWFKRFISEKRSAQVRSVFDKLMKDEIEPVEYFENEVLNRNGDVRLIAWHNTVIRDHNGKLSGTISSGEDITEKRQAILKSFVTMPLILTEGRKFFFRCLSQTLLFLFRRMLRAIRLFC